MIDSTVHTGALKLFISLLPYILYTCIYTIYSIRKGVIFLVCIPYFTYSTVCTVVEIHYSVGQPDSGMWRKLLFRPGREGFPGDIFWLFNII